MRRCCFAMPLLFVVGCGDSSVAVPKLNPVAAATTALEDYDRNKDGQLDADELARSPGLRVALPSLDADKDGAVSKAEITNRIATYWKDQLAVMPFQCQILFNQQPLSGATVTLVPERFMGSEVKRATGTTDANGLVGLTIEGQPVPGVHCGIYRMEVRSTLANPPLPAKYHDQTTLGQEIASDLPTAERGLIIQLSSE